LTGGLLTAPLVGEAQRAGKVYRIGSIGEVHPTTPPGQGIFYDRMRELGWVYGRDYILERRTYDGQVEHIPDVAAELIRWGVDVFFVSGSVQAGRVQQVTRTIPIVAQAGDLIAGGRAPSLARPGGNVTGIQTLGFQFAGKHLSLLKEVIPGFSRAGILWTGLDPAIGAVFMQEAEASAKVLNVQLQVPTVPSAGDFAAAFAAFQRDQAQAILVLRSPLIAAHFQTVASLALKHRLPAICDSFLASYGALMTYGVNWSEVARSLADISDKVFRGVKPSEIPIQQPTMFWLTINLKTAKALGLTIPQSLLQRADQVIE
jgi:putative ABC transport system substrate-binding protein